MRLIRRSEVIDFLRCRKLWDYRWQQNLEPARPDGKLFFGNLFHKFIEAYYDAECISALQAKEAMKQLFNKTDTSMMAQTDLDDLWNLAEKVTSNYVQQWGHIDSTWQVIATELTFAIPLDGDLYYTGTIDVIFKDADGKLFFMDHKTASSIQRYVDKVELDTQISCYWWALEQLARGNGLVQLRTAENEPFWHAVKETVYWQERLLKNSEPSGFIYNIILKDYPEPPEPLKKGGLSKAKAQKTTYAMYLQALKEHGLYFGIQEDPHHPGYQIIPVDHPYSEILIHLNQQETEHGNRFFRRIPVVRSERQVQTAMHELLATTMDVGEVRDYLESKKDGWLKEDAISPIYRNPTHDCSWCNFRSLCTAEMDGVNAELVRNTLYKQKETEQEWHDISE